jgi:haloacid dehalogenase-like hydrolase
VLFVYVLCVYVLCVVLSNELIPKRSPGDANQPRSSDRHGVARCIIVWQKIAGPADTLKPGARAAVEAVHAMGLEVAMITEDHAHTAATAQQVGIDRVLAEVLPHGKAAVVAVLGTLGFAARYAVFGLDRQSARPGGAVSPPALPLGGAGVIGAVTATAIGLGGGTLGEAGGWLKLLGAFDSPIIELRPRLCPPVPAQDIAEQPDDRLWYSGTFHIGCANFFLSKNIIKQGPAAKPPNWAQPPQPRR